MVTAMALVWTVTNSTLSWVCKYVMQIPAKSVLQCKRQFARSRQISEFHTFAPAQCRPGRMPPFPQPLWYKKSSLNLDLQTQLVVASEKTFVVSEKTSAYGANHPCHLPTRLQRLQVYSVSIATDDVTERDVHTDATWVGVRATRVQK